MVGGTDNHLVGGLVQHEILERGGEELATHQEAASSISIVVVVVTGGMRLVRGHGRCVRDDGQGGGDDRE